MIGKFFAFLLSLLPQPHADAELFCLTSTVYGEARGESEIGQALVAATVLNRVEDPRWPDTVCKVVSQRRQFSGFKAAYPKTAQQYERWQLAERIAYAVRSGLFQVGSCGRATHFHAGYINPRWSVGMTRLCRVDGHIFYEDA